MLAMKRFEASFEVRERSLLLSLPSQDLSYVEKKDHRP